MTDFNTAFKKHANRIMLTDAERSRIRAKLLGGAPLPVRSPYVGVVSVWSYSRTLAVALSFILVLTGAGGTLYAAEGALPGDILYAVKTNVSEPLSGAFAFSDEAEAKWHEKVATARLTEAETLAKEGRLTDENSAELAESFARHAKNIALRGQDEGGTAAESDISEALSLDADTAAENVKETEKREEAKERFRAVVAAKGASILEATAQEGKGSGRIASAQFVLRVLDDGASQAEDAANQAADTSRMAKSAEPQMAMMAFSAPPETRESGQQGDQDLESLARDAKEAFAEASAAISRKGQDEARGELSRMLRMLVRAEAEMVTGSETEARMHFSEVIERARFLRETYGRDARAGSESEHDSDEDSDDRERRDEDQEDDEESPDEADGPRVRSWFTY